MCNFKSLQGKIHMSDLIFQMHYHRNTTDACQLHLLTQKLCDAALMRLLTGNHYKIIQILVGI